MRKPLLVANWKMHKTSGEGGQFIEELKKMLPSKEKEVVVCPPYTALWAVAESLKKTTAKLGAQNCHWEMTGAFTGEVSPVMLKDAGCSYVIIGHSERRQYFAETDETVNKKVHAAMSVGMVPIVCVGESLKQRENNETFTHLRQQVQNGLAGVTSEQAGRVVIAYEPIWAIGTGRSASHSDAQRVISFLRDVCAELFGGAAAEVRILYGGSVKPDNIAEFGKEPDIDGALVGGASLDPESFAAIIAGF